MDPSALVFTAGVTLKEGVLYATQGRSLCVVAHGETLFEALENTYANVKKISFAGMQFRTDIGKKGIEDFSL